MTSTQLLLQLERRGDRQRPDQHLFTDQGDFARQLWYRLHTGEPQLSGSQPTSYAVVAGDTLASIAKSFLGDAQVWYLIADANGLTAGPDDSLESQVGRSLRIPNVVSNVRNNADTFSPYNPNTIISNTP